MGRGWGGTGPHVPGPVIGVNNLPPNCTSACVAHLPDTYLVLQWSPSIMDTTGTKGFVLYSEVSFAQWGDCWTHPSYICGQLCCSKTMDHEIS